ncbi:hypothetical protein Hanom_Chr14g01309301 [Helianthus anomalus]
MTWNDSDQHKLEQLQHMMTWYMLHQPYINRTSSHKVPQTSVTLRKSRFWCR